MHDDQYELYALKVEVIASDDVIGGKPQHIPVERGAQQGQCPHRPGITPHPGYPH